MSGWAMWEFCSSLYLPPGWRLSKFFRFAKRELSKLSCKRQIVSLRTSDLRIGENTKVRIIDHSFTFDALLSSENVAVLHREPGVPSVPLHPDRDSSEILGSSSLLLPHPWCNHHRGLGQHRPRVLCYHRLQVLTFHRYSRITSPFKFILFHFSV